MSMYYNVEVDYTSPPNSPWRSFWHKEGYSTGSGPSKDSQKLALWHDNKCADWSYIALKGMSREFIQTFYKCSDVELVEAESIIVRFFYDVDRRFV